MNLDELNKTTLTEQQAQAKFQSHIHVCTGTACAALNSEGIVAALKAELVKQGQQKTCHVKSVGCPGLCAIGPLVQLTKDDGRQATDDDASSSAVQRLSSILYQHVSPQDASDIVASLDAAPVERLNYPTDQPFFTRQHKIVLENCGEIDPERIEDYIAHGGYSALVKALTEMTPAQVIEQITQSGLRGRGGAGFPTGVKWATVAKSPPPNVARQNGGGASKYVICNGDEGDPGAFMDRSVMEGDPHRVIEGMIIAGYAVGASKGYLYVRAEYPLAVKRLKTAIRHAERNGFLGKSVCGTSFSFDIDIRLGAGAFVCGEETALMASIEGNRGQPRPRPPFPAESGLWGCPTLINNVETFANIAPILRKGAAWFAGIGTEKSKGTKVFALVGQITNSGLIEVPMGVSLREIIFDIGGGIPGGRAFKAVQTGGPSGGCIPEPLLDMPVDYESLNQAGTIMGSGGMIVMDDSTSMVDVARYYMEFCMDESCGKCVPCRVGTVQMHRLLTKFAEGNATRADMAKLEGLCDLVKNTSLCGLGQTAPNPVLSTLRYFRNEYEEKMTA
jgi:bidirectional [NiFe] hydrogenase diaphorase subunit